MRIEDIVDTYIVFQASQSDLEEMFSTIEADKLVVSYENDGLEINVFGNTFRYYDNRVFEIESLEQFNKLSEKLKKDFPSFSIAPNKDYPCIEFDLNPWTSLEIFCYND